jgi:hypothetical protein
MKNRLLILAFSLIAISLNAKAADMPPGKFVGTWKVNFAKSKFPGKPPLVDMATIDPDGTVTIRPIQRARVPRGTTSRLKGRRYRLSAGTIPRCWSRE